MTFQLRRIDSRLNIIRYHSSRKIRRRRRDIRPSRTRTFQRVTSTDSISHGAGVRG